MIPTNQSIIDTLASKGILRVVINRVNFLLVFGARADRTPDGVSPNIA